MPGRGLPPKPPEQRARRNKEPVPVRVIDIEPAAQPELPDRPGYEWPEITRNWWAMWGRSPLAREFTETDWSELGDTALIHARFWAGDMKCAAELRQRVAKFGATPEDRARLRIVFAQAADADGKVGTRTPSSARGRYEGLKLTG